MCSKLPTYLKRFHEANQIDEHRTDTEKYTQHKHRTLKIVHGF